MTHDMLQDIHNAHFGKWVSENSWLNARHEAWVAGLPSHVKLICPNNPPTIMAVGGGKGGVGKSFLSANLAAKLGDAGHKVLLIDLDMGGANLHTYLGMNMNQNSLADFLLYERRTFSEVILNTPNRNVNIITGGKDESWAFDGESYSTASLGILWESILNARSTHGFDTVILDLGAGIQRYAIDFFQAAHLGILTVLPEPTSIENAYTFLKATMCRLIENVGTNIEEFDASHIVKELLTGQDKTRGLSYAEKIRNMYPEYPRFVEEVFYALSGRQLGIVVNQVHSQRDIDLGQSMNQICQNYFAFQTVFLGYLAYDEAARKSLRNKRLLVQDFPHAILAKRVTEIAKNTRKCLGYL